MKRILFIVGLFLIFIIPFSVNAATITSTEVSGTTTKKVGEEVTVTFKIKLSGLEVGDDKTLGIALAAVFLEYDTDILIPTSATATGFESNIYRDSDNNYYVYSLVSENIPASVSCAGGNLYCKNEYKVDVKFYIKDTTKTSTTVKIKDYGVALLNYDDPNREYTDDDIIELEGIANKSVTITIKQNTTTTTKPKDITTKNDTSTDDIINKTINTKSDNAYLKLLTIEGYEIDFDKDDNTYTIEIDENINKLNIKAETYSGAATYKIIGAEDLKNNNYKAKIEVKAESGKTNTYTVIAKIKGNEEEKKIVEEEENVNTDNTYKKLLKYTFIGIGGFLGIVILIFIVSKIRDKKYEKFLE